MKAFVCTVLAVCLVLAAAQREELQRCLEMCGDDRACAHRCHEAFGRQVRQVTDLNSCLRYCNANYSGDRTCATRCYNAFPREQKRQVTDLASCLRYCEAFHSGDRACVVRCNDAYGRQ